MMASNESRRSGQQGTPRKLHAERMKEMKRVVSPIVAGITLENKKYKKKTVIK